MKRAARDDHFGAVVDEFHLYEVLALVRSLELHLISVHELRDCGVAAATRRAPESRLLMWHRVVRPERSARRPSPGRWARRPSPVCREVRYPGVWTGLGMCSCGPSDCRSFQCRSCSCSARYPARGAPPGRLARTSSVVPGPAHPALAVAIRSRLTRPPPTLRPRGSHGDRCA